LFDFVRKNYRKIRTPVPPRKMTINKL